MKTSNKLYLIALALVSFTFTSCESEDPVIENDGELITDVTLTFHELDASGNLVGDSFDFTASDAEGIEIGTTPNIETVMLEKGKTYQMTIDVFNSVANEDITEEIKAEGEAHQFYFLGSAFNSSPFLSYQYNDGGSELIGLKGKLTVQQSPGFNNANMQIILRHDLDKSFPGASNPNFEEYVKAGGESDLDITFPVVLK
ncbi:hypothetical protein LV84_02987 [Algoriphagus ratkowskyi]|uniref:Type 1 periplasmic binding fold superfamily protein n=1 Tax=Algoriphagus ratkowskyi TaxID=57028 RepID=A0A2W7RHR5_9BACT|nr:hypothetical protein [Algoriphagus ratkowskyi]PZX53879.1 hypothetical protein LV84_02987 [Algoriphagus ratkowskyi]TXD76717.1 hypothetical protein ESW18_15250 [Algoriphagus ratkowskyi]